MQYLFFAVSLNFIYFWFFIFVLTIIILKIKITLPAKMTCTTSNHSYLSVGCSPSPSPPYLWTRFSWAAWLSEVDFWSRKTKISSSKEELLFVVPKRAENGRRIFNQQPSSAGKNLSATKVHLIIYH